jgi:hypothetical protein
MARRGLPRWALISLGVVALLLGLLAFIPASLLEGAVARRNLSLVLTNTTGTVWSGSAMLLVADSPQAARTPQANRTALRVPITWSFAPTSLARARLGFDVTAGNDALRDIAGTAVVEAGVTDVAIRKADMRLSMAALARVSRDVALFRPTGLVHVRSGERTVTIDYRAPHNMAGEVRLNANEVRLRAAALLGLSVPLGSYAGRVTFAGQRIDYRIDESKGVLALTGSGHVTRDANREFHYDGFATPLPGSPPWLLGALSGLGRITPDGRVKLDVKAKY